MATPIRAIVTAAFLVAAMGISCNQKQPRAKPLRIGLSFPFYIQNPASDEEPLDFPSLTDADLANYWEDAGVDWRTKAKPLFFDIGRRFRFFSFTLERDGGKTFYAKLKPDILFHDGSVATLDDVEFSLNRDLERSLANHRIVFKKLSPRSFVLSSDRPEDWVYILSTPLKKRVGAGEKSISAGPYIITAVDRGKRKVRLKAFEKYVGGPPLASEMEYTFYNNSEVAMFGFLAGETDFMCGLSYGNKKTIAKLSGIRIVGYASTTNFMLAFNIAKPPMDDILARKAISLLIDRHGLISKSESLRGGAIPTQYQFAMSNPITKPQAEPYAPAEAFKLLQKAGYARTAKGWEKDGKPIRISMQMPSHLSVYIPEVRMICRWLGEAGLDTNFEVTPSNKFNDSQTINKFHIMFSGFYDHAEFKENSRMFELGNLNNSFQSTDPAPAKLLADVKNDSLTTSAKEAIIRKIADYSYSAPLFYPVEYCAGRGNAEYEDMFFRSPMLFSIINRDTPSGPKQSKAGPGTNGH